MFANQTNRKTRLFVATQRSPVDVPRSSIFPLPGEAEFPGPPAMADALLRLELCLSGFAADLQDVTNILRSDVGLTVQLLRLAAKKIEHSPEKISAISETVVQVGVENLAALAVQTKPLPRHLSGDPGTSAYARFWMHSRLIALLAEQLAGELSDVNADEAYVAGLLCHVGELPLLIGCETTGSDAEDTRHVSHRMAEAWGFPRALVDVIGGNHEDCRTRESRALLDLVEAADNWASRLESLAVRDSKSVPLRIHLIDQTG